MMQDRKERYALGGLILIYTVLFGLFATARHQRLQSAIFDLGIFDQALYLLAKGDTHFLSTRGLHIHGDHFHPVLNLLAPFYLLGLSVTGLLFLQSFIVALGTVPVFYIARHHGLSRMWAFLFAVAYLSHPTVSFLNQFDFHPTAAMMPFLLAGVFFLEKGRPKAYSLSLILAMTCTEAAGFTVIALSATALIIRGARWAVGTLSLGFSGIILSKLSLMHFLNGHPAAYAALYTDYGTTEKEVLLRLLIHPIQTASSLFVAVNFEYLFYLLAPLLFLPLLAPERLIPFLPTLMGNLLSWRYSQHRVEFHYGAAIAPFLIWAAIVGWKRLANQNKRACNILGVLLIVGTVLAVLRGPVGKLDRRHLPESANLTNALRQVDPTESVSAEPHIGAHFSRREELYLFPSPFIPVAWGSSAASLIHQSNSEYAAYTRGAFRRGVESTTVEWVAFPSSAHRRTTFPNRNADDTLLRRQLERSNYFQPIETGDDVRLFRRRKRE